MKRNIFERSSNGGSYINYDSLPKINGVLIDGIWCPDDFIHDNVVLDTTQWHYDSYFRNVEERGEGGNKINAIGSLPDEFKKLLGWQVIDGKGRVFVRHISFRTSSSGNGSFTDDIMTIYAKDNNDISVYNSENFTKSNCPQFTEKHPYVKQWLGFCGKNFKIKYPAKNTNAQFEKMFINLPEHMGTFFENIGGFNYPCTESKPWQPFWSDPFVSLDNGENLRVWDENMKAHLYIQRVRNLEKGDTNLIRLSIAVRNSYFVIINRWNKNREIARFDITSLNRKKKIAFANTMCNGKALGKPEPYNIDSFYRIQRITKI